MSEKIKLKPRKSGLLQGAYEGYSYDDFTKPLTDEQKEQFDSYKNTIRKLEATGKPFNIDIIDDEDDEDDED